MKNKHTKKILIATTLLAVGVSGYVWINPLKTKSKENETNNQATVFKDKENEAKKSPSNVVQPTTGNKTEATTAGNETANTPQNTPKQSDNTEPESEKTRAVLLHENEITVEKDTIIELFDYVEIFGHRSGVRVEFSDRDVVEVLSDTPNMIPTKIKVKSSVSVKVITDTNTVTFDIKVK